MKSADVSIWALHPTAAQSPVLMMMNPGRCKVSMLLARLQSSMWLSVVIEKDESSLLTLSAIDRVVECQLSACPQTIMDSGGFCKSIQGSLWKVLCFCSMAKPRSIKQLPHPTTEIKRTSVLFPYRFLHFTEILSLSGINKLSRFSLSQVSSTIQKIQAASTSIARKGAFTNSWPTSVKPSNSPNSRYVMNKSN